MAKVTRTVWGGIIQYEDDDTPVDVRAFNDFGKSATFWLLQSRELFRSARHLMSERDRQWNEVTHLFQAPIALMLGAYAIETLLKMVIVAAYCDKHGSTLKSHHASEFLPKSHNLVALLKQANLRTNKDDRTLLHELGRYSIWAGRYPIPLRSEGYSGPALFEAIEPVPAKVTRQHPTWPKLLELYPKLFRMAVRKTFKDRDFVLKPKSEAAR